MSQRQKSLTDNDVILLLEGDVSDADVGESDADDEEACIEREVRQPGPASTPEILGMEVEIQNEEEIDFDDVPLAARLQTQIGDTGSVISNIPDNRSRYVRWRHKDIEDVNSCCDVHFSDPQEEMTPFEYFKTMCGEDVIENLVHQSNLYCTQITGNSLDTNKEEVEQYLGIHIMAGIVKMPSYRMYWAEKTRYPLIADVMSRNRFDKLRSYFHVNDNSRMKARTDPDYDKLFKVRPFVDKIRENFGKIEPEEHNVVDELIIPFKGRSSLKQYIKNKPHRWGIKVFARAGSSGIINDFEIYRGKGTLQNSDSNLGISGDIVIRLCEGLPKYQNYKIFTDNWFTSYRLISTLKQMGILALGTVRIARLQGCTLKTDQELKKVGRGADDYRTEVEENIIALKWYDNKSVHLASSYVGRNPVETVKRWSVAQKQHVEVPIPKIVKVYNCFMGGVDLHDMLVALYRSNIGVRRFYLRIVFHLIDMCVVNAWLLYRRHCGQTGVTKHMSLLTFRSDIAHALLQAGKSTVRKRGRPSNESNSPLPQRRAAVTPTPVDDARYDAVAHWPIHVDTKQRCKLCIKAYSRIRCSKCSKAFCLTKTKNCFMDYHVK
ncbi:piggyBac transposable element-derived protein 2-like [Anabrus simplex]|uniref:piggyBac transposable element-derived protein 2-like n=1 Tax=Anabrus simplex TaxID=316456 RepID=UPI0035A2FA23